MGRVGFWGGGVVGGLEGLKIGHYIIQRRLLKTQNGCPQEIYVQS